MSRASSWFPSVFPFPELEEFRIDRAMCKIMEKDLGSCSTRAYVCSHCVPLLVRDVEVEWAQGDVIDAVNMVYKEVLMN